MSKDEKSATTPQGPIFVQIRGEDPMDAPPALYSNFLGISRVATDVQFEFIFLDLNQVAQIIQSGQGSESAGAASEPIRGQTVAKIVMPAVAFIQLRDHLVKLMADLDKDIAHPKEAQNVDASDRRATGA